MAWNALRRGRRTTVVTFLCLVPACESPSPERDCEPQEIVDVPTPDGCSLCWWSDCYPEWGCTQELCWWYAIGLNPRACTPEMCVIDTSAADGLQASCQFFAGPPYESVPPCLGEGEGALIPDGVAYCFYLITGDARSESCQDWGRPVEVQFLYERELGEELEFSGACETPSLEDWLAGAQCVGGGQVPADLP